MSKLTDLCQFAWPWLEKHTPQELQALKDRQARDEARIDALDLRQDPEVALDEARRVADSENERRRGTDQKAATYLPLVAALIPLILTVVSALWEKKAGSAPVWINMFLLGLAVAYTASAGRWAFKELQVAVSHELGLGDFERAWGAPHPTQTLARRFLLHTRRNQDGINWKVSCIIMAHAFLLRAFLTFSLLLIVNIGWYLGGTLLHASLPVRNLSLKTPQQAVAAMVSIDRLADELKTVPAWDVLGDDCRHRSGGRAALKMFTVDTFAVASPPLALRPAAGEIVSAQNIRLECLGKVVGRSRAWFVTARLTSSTQKPSLPELLGAATSRTILEVKRNWPSSMKREDPASLPPALLRQSVQLHADDGRPRAFIVTAITAAAIMDSNRAEVSGGWSGDVNGYRRA